MLHERIARGHPFYPGKQWSAGRSRGKESRYWQVGLYLQIAAFNWRKQGWVLKKSASFWCPRLTPHYNETSVGLPALKQWQVSRLLLAHSRIGPVV